MISSASSLLASSASPWMPMLSAKARTESGEKSTAEEEADEVEAGVGPRSSWSSSVGRGKEEEVASEAKGTEEEGGWDRGSIRGLLYCLQST